MFEANAMGIFGLISVAMCWAFAAALTEALPDGNISERERALLNRFRDSLRISESDADAIERELQAKLPSVA